MTDALKILAETGGIYGIVIFGLAGAIVLLWRHLGKTQDKYDKLQENRVAEAKAVVTELMLYGETMKGLTAAINTLLEVVRATRQTGG